MKFVKGKREDENQIKNLPVESKKVTSEKNEKMEEPIRDDDFMCRDKSVTKLHKAVWNENSDKLKSIIKTHDIDITDRLDRSKRALDNLLARFRQRFAFIFFPYFCWRDFFSFRLTSCCYRSLTNSTSSSTYYPSLITIFN